MEFPAITVCNENPFRASKIQCDKQTGQMEQLQTTVSDKTLNWIRTVLKLLYFLFE